MTAPDHRPYKPDTYGYTYAADTGYRRAPRHPLCSCRVPCQRRFTCTGVGHTGRRSVPWCRGAHPGDECDVCWARSETKR